MKKLIFLVLLASAAAQTTTTYTGTIKDLTQTVVSSGQVTFELRPGIDTTISGTARFTPATVVCTINGGGLVKALDGTSPCVTTNNTSLSPAGTSYKICIQPYSVTPGSCFNDYALGGSKDITTIVPTPGTMPAFTFLDLNSTQTITGSKTFTGAQTLFGNGTTSLPGIGFSTQTGSGIWNTTNQIGLSLNGISALKFDVTAAGGSGVGAKNNVYVGPSAGLANTASTTGYINIAIGEEALKSTTAGFANVAIGYQALMTTAGFDSSPTFRGVQNVAVGAQALTLLTNGNNNIGVGTQTLQTETTGSSNIAIGSNAMNLSTTGDSNVAIGSQSLYNLTTGVGNIALGLNSGFNVLTGNYNILLGYGAGTGQGDFSNTFVAGGTSGQAITNVYFGKGVKDASPTAYRINGTQGLGANIAGGGISFSGGGGTGTGAGGDITFVVQPAAGAGSSINGDKTVAMIANTGVITLGSPSGSTGFGDIDQDGGAFKHVRTASCSTTNVQFNTCGTSITWTTAFKDANYTTVCMIDNPTNTPIVAFTSGKLAGSISVNIMTMSAAIASGTLNCIAVHK